MLVPSHLRSVLLSSDQQACPGALCRPNWGGERASPQMPAPFPATTPSPRAPQGALARARFLRMPCSEPCQGPHLGRNRQPQRPGGLPVIVAISTGWLFLATGPNKVSRVQDMPLCANWIPVGSEGPASRDLSLLPWSNQTRRLALGKRGSAKTGVWRTPTKRWLPLAFSGASHTHEQTKRESKQPSSLAAPQPSRPEPQTGALPCRCETLPAVPSSAHGPLLDIAPRAAGAAARVPGSRLAIQIRVSEEQILQGLLLKMRSPNMAMCFLRPFK